MDTLRTFVDRRTFLEGAAFVTAAAICGRSFAIARHHDDALLDDLSRRCFQYFWDATDPDTGICRDLIHGALALALVGLYSVVAYLAAQRTQEFGIRIALDATRGNILWLVLRSNIRVIISGTAIGSVPKAGVL